MNRIILCLCALAGVWAAQHAHWPGWWERAPLNIDSSLVGFPSAMGLAKAYRYLAYLLNAGALALLLYAVGGQEADFSYFGYVYAGVTIGGILLSFALSPVLHVFAILPIFLFTAFLLCRFCGLRPTRGAMVALLLQAYQVAYIVTCKFLEAKLAGSL